MNSYMDTGPTMGGMADYLSWYCDNDQHFQCDRYHPRSLERCQCRCHAEPDHSDGEVAP